jgi:hypothetical protein
VPDSGESPGFKDGRVRDKHPALAGPARHIATALLEVMEIASVLGIHAVTTAAPILAEEAGRP